MATPRPVTATATVTATGDTPAPTAAASDPTQVPSQALPPAPDPAPAVVPDPAPQPTGGLRLRVTIAGGVASIVDLDTGQTFPWADMVAVEMSRANPGRQGMPFLYIGTYGNASLDVEVNPPSAQAATATPAATPPSQTVPPATT